MSEKSNAQELQPFKQRHSLVFGLLKHTNIERELRELTVDVVLR